MKKWTEQKITEKINKKFSQKLKNPENSLIKILTLIKLKENNQF